MDLNVHATATKNSKGFRSDQILAFLDTQRNQEVREKKKRRAEKTPQPKTCVTINTIDEAIQYLPISFLTRP